MRSVLGIDLGLQWRSIGSAVLSFDDIHWVSCTPGAVVWPETVCDPSTIAGVIVEFALKNKICAISLDGPQGWRDPDAPGGFVGRECERLTRTPGKTGKFGVAIPGTWLRWIRASVEVFDRLLGTQHAMLANSTESDFLTAPPVGRFYVLECFPTSTWRQAELRALPGHRADMSTIQRCAGALGDAFGLPEIFPSRIRHQVDHDNLQAVVAALPAAGLLGGPCQAVPKGLPARMIPARNAMPAHRAEGIIWDAMPALDRRYLSGVWQAVPIASHGEPVPMTDNPESSDRLMPDEDGLDRGVRLFAYFVKAANRGDAVGISYGGFIAHLHGVAAFVDVAGRNFLPSDAMAAVRIAWKVTEKAGGRKKIVRSQTEIDAGMDTFVWNARPPFDRPVGAWNHPIPYTREQWLSVFPNSARRLITLGELRCVASAVK